MIPASGNLVRGDERRVEKDRRVVVPMALPVDQAASKMEQDIISANLENQDNYTCIILRYNG